MYESKPMDSWKTVAAAIFVFFIIILVAVAFFCFPQVRPIVRCSLNQWKKTPKGKPSGGGFRLRKAGKVQTDY